MFTLVYLSLPKFSYGYLSLSKFTQVYLSLPKFSQVYSSLPKFTQVYPGYKLQSMQIEPIFQSVKIGEVTEKTVSADPIGEALEKKDRMTS